MLMRAGLDLRKQSLGLLEAGDEAHAPGERQLDLELAAHQLARQLLLPAQSVSRSPFATIDMAQCSMNSMASGKSPAAIA